MTAHETLAAAFVAAQAELTNPHKDKTANIKPGFSYRYADLATILDHVRPVLARHGLAISQDVGATPEGRLAIHTTIIHGPSGDRMTFGPLVGDTGRDWQSTGGAVTYARRYALTAALGIAADDDDDATAVSAQERSQPERKNASQMEVHALADAMRAASDTATLEKHAERARSMNMSRGQSDALRSVYKTRLAQIEGAS